MREERIRYLQILGAEKKPEPRPAEAAPPRRRRGRPEPRPQFRQGQGTRFRLRYTKLGRAAFIGHIDVMRLLARVFRRAEVPIVYSLGFHPKPQFTYAPALGLGIPSLGELFDVRVDGDPEPDELARRLNEVSPEGIVFTACRRVPDGSPGLSKRIQAADFLLRPRQPDWDQARLAALRTDSPFVLGLEAIGGEAAEKLARALDWAVGPMLRARVTMGAEGSVKPVELARSLGLEPAEIARLALVGLGGDAAGAEDFDPLETPAGVRSPPKAGVSCEAGTS
jgi:radical SAM-linked protein